MAPSPLTLIKPSFPPPANPAAPRHEPSPQIQSLLTNLSMIPHPEGGYFVETDRDPHLVPSLFPPPTTNSSSTALSLHRPGFNPAVRNASTTIYYLLTPASPQGVFHRNRARIIHTLHRGRGRYVVIHADEVDGSGGNKKARIETFVVGRDVAKGERIQWVVEGGKYKASFLLPDDEGGIDSEAGLLISETTVPGFEFCDHDFLERGGLDGLVGSEAAKGLEWLVRRDHAVPGARGEGAEGRRRG